MEQTKKCSKCCAEKVFSDFDKQKTGRHGLRRECKVCISKAGAEYRRKNAEKLAEKKAEYRRKNAEKLAEKKAEYHRTPAGRSAQAKTRVARAFLKKATRLAETYADEIKEIYMLANETAELSGLEIHVDHIIPLRGVTEEGNKVSGLHVPWNLHPVYAKTNLRKHNKACQADALAW